MSEMIQRAARAIEAEDVDNGPFFAIDEEEAERFAYVVISAMREPTEAMKKAFYSSCDDHGQVLWKYGWRALIDAALGVDTK
jgi:hypothetical protein